MRRLVFFECLQRFCTTMGVDGNFIPYQQVYKQLVIFIYFFCVYNVEIREPFFFGNE